MLWSKIFINTNNTVAANCSLAVYNASLSRFWSGNSRVHRTASLFWCLWLEKVCMCISSKGSSVLSHWLTFTTTGIFNVSSKKNCLCTSEVNNYQHCWMIFSFIFLAVCGKTVMPQLRSWYQCSFFPQPPTLLCPQISHKPCLPESFASSPLWTNLSGVSSGQPFSKIVSGAKH